MTKSIASSETTAKRSLTHPRNPPVIETTTRLESTPESVKTKMKICPES